MRKIVPFVFCCVLLSCCSNGDKTRTGGHGCTPVVVNRQEPLAAGDWIEEMRLLPLGSDGKHLIGQVDNVLFTPQCIVVPDMRFSKAVHIFNRDGSLRTVISRQGRGPEEYILPLYCTLTPDREKIALYDNAGNKVLFFDLDGNFVGKKQVGFRLFRFEYLDENHIVCATYGADDWGLGSAAGNLIVFTDGDFHVEGGAVRNRYAKNAGFPIVPELKKINEDVFVTPAFCDTVYKVTPNALDPYYCIDLSAFGRTPDIDAGTSFEEYSSIMERSTVFTGKFVANESFALFSFSENMGVEKKIFDRRTRKLFPLSYRSDVNNRHRINWFDPDLLSSEFVCDDWFVSVVPAYHILMGNPAFSTEFPELGALTEDSNPVLVFFKVKSPDRIEN